MPRKSKDKVAAAIWSTLEQRLFDLPSRPEAFNFYKDTHPELDVPGAAEIRRANLKAYLEAVSSPPTTFVVAPSYGWRSTRFTGVPFTSQLQLMRPDFPLSGRPTSKGTHLIEEKTGKHLWTALLPHFPEIFLWAAFPLQPHRKGEPTTNRTPTLNEIEDFLPILEEILDALDPRQVLAVGRSAEWTLRQLGVEFTSLKNPSTGGLRAFQRGVGEVFPDEEED